MTTWLWLPAGLLVGLLNVVSIARTVGWLRPEEGGSPKVAPPVAALSLIASGFVLRLILSALVLVVALRQSALAGLLAFAGLWLGRWTVLFWVNASATLRKVKA